MLTDERNWPGCLRGKFVVFDGPDGCGKTTQFRRLAQEIEAADVEVCQVREPGGTEIGEQIRAVLLDPANAEEVDIRCEMLLFMASRAQLISQKIKPALARGALVLADRFISSTLAYQGAAGGIPIEQIMQVGQVALGQYWPDLVVVFDVDQATALKRMNPLLREREFDAAKDRMEMKDLAFHRTVREGYLQQAREHPRHYAVIDARGDEQTVYAALLEAMHRHFGGAS